MQTAMLVEEEAPEAPAPVETAQALPQTGSQLPLIALFGLLALVLSFAIKVIRRLG
jgi:LPXTG-motif cell wall-anchored protein